MPKTEKICPVCGISSKALHLHQRKHDKEIKAKIKEYAEKPFEAVEPVTQPVAEPTHLEPEPMQKEVETMQPEGQDIPLTPEMAETPTEKEEVTNTQNCEYFLEMSFNGEVYQAYTNNLDISIQSFAKPVLTEMFCKIAKNNQGDPFVKKLTLVQAKQLFNDPQNREIFLNLYYGLYGKSEKS